MAKFFVFSVKNDEEAAELRSLGFTGSLNDMQKAFLLNEGLSGALNDLLNAYTGVPSGPVNTVAPAITGTAEVGETLTCSAGTWTGTGTITYAYQWRRNGSNIAAATANTYTLVSADDSTTVDCVVTATDDEGSTGATATGVSVTYAAPVAAGGLADQTYFEDTGDKTVDASTDFTGAVGGSWSVTGTEASIDSAGTVTIGTATARSLSTVTVTYTNSGGSDSSGFSVTVNEGVTITPEAGLSASIAADGDTTYTITVASPAEYAGTYTTNTAGDPISDTLLNAGLPIELKAAVLTESPAGTFTATEGLWLTPSNDTAVFTQRWQRDDGTTIAAGVTYTLSSPADDGRKIDYTEIADNVAGQTIGTEVVAQAGFAETGVVFDGTNDLLTVGRQASADASSVLFFANFTVGELGRTQSVFFADFEFSVGLGSNNVLGVLVRNTAGTIVMNSGSPALTVALNDRVSVLFECTRNGASRLATKVNSGSWVTRRDTTIADVDLDLDSTQFYIAGDSNASRRLNGTVYRVAVWSGITVPDVTSATVQDYFVNSGNSLVDPSVSEAQYGTALEDWYGNAAAWNAGTAQNGSNTGGTITMTGAVTDA